MPHTNQHPDTQHLKARYRAENHKLVDDVRIVRLAFAKDGSEKVERRVYQRATGERRHGAPSFKSWVRNQPEGWRWFGRKASRS